MVRVAARELDGLTVVLATHGPSTASGSAYGAAMESNHPTGGLLRPAGFEGARLLGAVGLVCRDFVSGGSRCVGSDLPSWGHGSGHGIADAESKEQSVPGLALPHVAQSESATCAEV